MRFTEVMRRYLPLGAALSITLGLLAGHYYPGIASLERLIPLLLFFMLYPMMVNLRVEDIGKAVKNPRLVAVALAINFLVTPPLGALWAYFLFRHSDPLLAVGFILKVTVPCSGMVAAWTGYARGRVESALVIVALSLLTAIVAVPLWMWVLAGRYVAIDPGMIFQKMLIIVVLPLGAGLFTRRLLVRRYGPQGYRQVIAPYFPAISSLGMLGMVFIIIAGQANLILANLGWMLQVVLGIATLYPLIFALAIAACKLTRLDHGHGMAVGYSVAAKNHAITIGLATTAFGGTLAVLPAAVAPIIQIPLMLIFLRLSRLVEKLL